MISTLIALPYELARLPLVVVDQTLSPRLAETSAPRVTLDRTIGSADKLAGSVLGNRGIAQRGQDRLERARTLRAAAQHEKQAASARKEADAAATTGLHEAIQKREAAEEQLTSGLREAEVVEVRGKREAKAKAARTASAKKRAADQHAESRTTAAEQRKQRTESAAEARKKAAQRSAKAELDEARQAKQAANQDRSDAERLGDLAEVKKQQRKQK